MKISVHRGDQIGGCITEIATQNHRIIIDLGANLPGSEKKEFDKSEIAKITKGSDAIFYTHYHGDHVDLFPLVPDGIPQYIGECAREIMKIKYTALKKNEAVRKIEKFRTYKAQNPETFGDIKVTPYFTSHSAYDSYMLLVEADGKRILHTGDFRSHGYMGKALINGNDKKNLLKQCIKNVDILITEGTMLARKGEKVMTEYELQQEAKKIMKELDGTQYKYVFVQSSSTDIDRLASFYAATKSLKRPFVCDNYQNEVLQKFTEYAGAKSSLYSFDKAEVYNLNDYVLNQRMKKYGFCMMVRPSQTKLVNVLLDKFGRENCLLIYSVWSGYYNGKYPHATNEDYIQFRNLFSKVTDLHTSGHADPETLKYVIETLQPHDAIVGIHKDAGTSLLSLDISDTLAAKIVPDNYQPEYIKIKQSVAACAPSCSEHPPKKN